MNISTLLKRGIIDENPVFIQVLGLCPLLAVTTSASNAIAMGLSTTAVMICASTIISLLRKLIPNEVRIAAYIVVIAGFVTILQLLMAAYVPPSINEALGIYIPLIVVNCIVFARVEACASKNKPLTSAIDALGMGLGFTVALLAIGILRELLGSGSIFGVELLRSASSHILIMVMAPGGFFALGIIMMIINYFRLKKEASSR